MPRGVCDGMPGLQLPDSSWCTNTLSLLSTLRWCDGSSSASDRRPPAIGAHDLSPLRRVLFGASPMNEALLDRAVAALPDTQFVQA